MLKNMNPAASVCRTKPPETTTSEVPARQKSKKKHKQSSKKPSKVYAVSEEQLIYESNSNGSLYAVYSKNKKQYYAEIKVTKWLKTAPR